MDGQMNRLMFGWLELPPFHNSHVDWDADQAEVDPLADVVHVDPDEEHEDQHEQHAPELPSTPLGDAQLREELTPWARQVYEDNFSYYSRKGSWHWVFQEELTF